MNQTLESTDVSALRQEVLNRAKDFKTSWIEMGRALMAVHQDKHYKDWGFREFETYCVKEIGIKKATAQKLIRSYCFLEKEEPRYVKHETYEENNVAKIPDYESVDVLRRAKEKNFEDEDYEGLRLKVLEEGRPPQTVKQHFKTLVEENSEKTADEIEEDKQKTLLRRYVSTIKALKTEIASQKHIPKNKKMEIEKLADKLGELLSESLS